MSPFDPNEVREELERVTRSPHLSHSPNLQRFLRFIVEQELGGRGGEIKESVIAAEVFRRRGDFDPRLDSIVRVQATMLRKKLAAYYAAEGAGSRIEIELAKGGYVPAFRCRQKVETVPSVAAPRRWTQILRLAPGMAILCVLAALMVLGIRFVKPTHASTIWSSYLKSGARTIVVYGTPQFFQIGGLFLRDVNVNSAADIDSRSPIVEWQRVAGSRDPISVDSTHVYTGIGEAFGVQKISRYFWENSRLLELRLDSDFNVEDALGSNLIIVSSMRFQTFLNKFRFPSDFTRVTPPEGRGEAVLNAHPGPNETQLYRSLRPAQSSQSVEYAVVSLWPWRDAGHRILALAGTTTYATQAAAQFVTDPVALNQLEKRLAATGHPAYFQCLLRVYLSRTHIVKVEYVTHHALTPMRTLVARD